VGNKLKLRIMRIMMMEGPVVIVRVEGMEALLST